MSWWLTVVAEAIRAAKAQRVISVISVVIIGAMCASVLLTAGRAAGVERQVLDSIDSAGTRAIVVRAQDNAGLDTGVLRRLAQVEGISWIGAFGPAVDTQNALIPDGTKVPMRPLWTEDLSPLRPTGPLSGEGRVGGSSASLEALGMIDGAGSVITQDGKDHPVVARLVTPDYLATLEPLLVLPGQSDGGDPVSLLVVVAASPELVPPVADVVRSVLGVTDPQSVSIQTSEKFALLRGVVQDQLGGFGRNLTLILLAGAAALVGSILYAFVLIRRKDFGRRRALGATRGLIVVLLATQTAFVSIVGAIFGCAIGVAAIAAGGDPLPQPTFIAAIAALSVVVGVAGSIVPALAASRRDPIKELRVP